MNPQQPDLQRALVDLDARLGRITAEVAEVRAGLSSLVRQSGPAESQAAPAGPAPQWSQSQSQSQSQWQPQPQPHPQSQQWQPGQGPGWGPTRAAGDPMLGPVQHGQPGQRANFGQPGQPSHPGQPQHPGRPDQPWRRPEPARPSRLSRITPATVIAAIGGAVMLAGIAFLLVVAIQAGLFPPIARVLGAAVLAAVLIGLGLWLQSRHEPTGSRPINPGALALVGTGLAAAMLDVIASTVLYQWVPMPAAYMFVGGLSLAGMALAQRWSSGLLACLVSAGTMLLAPLISNGVELPVFIAIVGLATAVLAADLGMVVRAVWSVFPAFMLTGYLSVSGTNSPGQQLALIVAAVVFASVGAVVAWFDTFRRSPAVENAALVVVPTAVPLLVLPTLDPLQPGWPVGLVLAAGYLTIAVFVARVLQPARPGAEPAGAEPAVPGSKGAMLLATVTGAVGSVFLVAAWGAFDDGAATGLALTLTAIAYVVAAGMWARRWTEWAAGIITVLAILTYLSVNRPFFALVESLAVRYFSYVDVVASFALTALAVAVTWWALRRRSGESSRVVMVGALTALATLSVLIVAAGVVIGDLAGTARTGFLWAHLVVTVLWICCAAWLVLTASPRIADARTLGFVLGALALAKLLFLDLATLPGLFRVLSFIVVGAVMLAVAVRYRGGSDESDSGPSGSGRSVSGPSGSGHNDVRLGGSGQNDEVHARQNPYYRRDTDPSGSGSPT